MPSFSPVEFDSNTNSGQTTTSLKTPTWMIYIGLGAAVFWLFKGKILNYVLDRDDE